MLHVPFQTDCQTAAAPVPTSDCLGLLLFVYYVFSKTHSIQRERSKPRLRLHQHRFPPSRRSRGADQTQGDGWRCLWRSPGLLLGMNSTWNLVASDCISGRWAYNRMMDRCYWRLSSRDRRPRGTIHCALWSASWYIWRAAGKGIVCWPGDVPS